MVSTLLIAIIFVAGLIFLIITAIVVWMIKKRLKKGDDKVKPTKKQVEEIDEIEEPDEEQIETLEDDAPDEVKKQPVSTKSFCTVGIEGGGKSIRGEYLGEEPQFATLQNGQLVKVDSFWVLLKTEQVELMKINRKHIVMITFESIPKAQAPAKPIQKKRQDEVEAEDMIESIDV